MRVDFVKTVTQELENEPKSLFITGDLGYGALEELAEKLGKRFINAGVAEQNMVGMAAGAALCGMHVWTYSIAPFATFRCLEQIRNDVCMHRLPVHVVGNGGGFTYGIMGNTHHALEDLGTLKPLPNMQLYFPCANDQVAAAVRQIAGHQGPTYLRLGISGFAAELPYLSENKRTLTRQYACGEKLTIIGVGHATQIALNALKNGLLPEQQADIFALTRFPFDLDADQEMVASISRTRTVVVLDEHYLAGSIAESLRLALGESVDVYEVMCPFYHPNQRYGSAKFHLQQCRMTPEDLARTAMRLTASPWRKVG